MIKALFVIVALHLMHQSAFAESISDAITKFGLVGIWSADCASRGDAQIAGTRSIYEIPMIGSPTQSLMAAWPIEGGNVKMVLIEKSEIKEAVRVTESKIRMGEIIIYQNPSVMGASRIGIKTEAVLERLGNKIRDVQFSVIYPDGNHRVTIRDGHINAAQGAAWQDSGRESPVLEKCLNNSF